MNPVIRITHTEEADPTIPAPCFQSAGAAGADLCANLPLYQRDDGILIEPGVYCLIPLGLIMQIPPGFEGQIRPRSGLAVRFGVTVLNAPGTIDSDYRGDVGVILINHGPKPYSVHHGDRIAQLVISPASSVSFQWCEIMNETGRGVGGFGSTGQR